MPLERLVWCQNKEKGAIMTNEQQQEKEKRKKGAIFWLSGCALPFFGLSAITLFDVLVMNRQPDNSSQSNFTVVQQSQLQTEKQTTTTVSVSKLETQQSTTTNQSSVEKSPLDEQPKPIARIEQVESVTNRVQATTTQRVDEQPVTQATTQKASAQATKQSTVTSITTTQSTTKQSTTVQKTTTQSTTKQSTTTQSTTTQSTTQQTTTVQAVDKTQLRVLLRDANKRQQKDYSPISWASLTNVLPNAKAMDSNDKVTQAQVDVMVAQLRRVLDGLTVDKRALQQVIAQAKAYVPENYSINSWETMGQRLNDANQIFENSNATQEQVNTALKQLQDAIAGLSVDKTALKRLLDTTNRYVQTDYSPVTWQAYNKVLQQAKATFDNASATQSQVDAALERLLQGISNLSVDKTVLKQTIDTANTYQEAHYSPTSFAQLQEAITHANTVYGNANATQQEINAAQERLNRAMAQLTVDKTALQQSITQGQGINETDYSQASYAALQQALTQAQNVNVNTSAKQSDVNSALASLQQALQQLVVDKSALRQLVQQAQTRVANDYTTVSFEAFQRALTQAQNTLNDANAKQSDVNAAIAQLNTAIDQLQRLKTRPILTLTQVTKQDLQRQVDLTYTLSDAQNAFVSAVVNVYQGTTLVKTVNVTNNSNATNAIIDGLQWGVDYQLQTVMTYNLGNTNQEQIVTPTTPIRLSPKSVTMTQTKKVSLVALQSDGTTQAIDALSSVPTDTSNLFAHFVSDTYKDVFLPIASITPVTQDGVTNYKVTVKDSAITHFDVNKETYEATYTFMVTGKKAAENNVYYDFDELVAVMNQTSNGTFYIGRDMSAKAVSVKNGQTSYVSTTFTGTLMSDPSATKLYKINDLALPLFNQMQNATVKNIHLANVAIDTAQTDVGALAKVSSGRTTVSNVLVKGTIKAPYNIGGLIYNATGSDSSVTNVGFVGTITATSTMQNDQYVGGILGRVQSVDVISSFFDGTLTVRANGSSSRVGGIIGGSDNWHSEIKQSYVKGTVNNTGNAGQVGGLVGSTWYNARAYNNVVYANVINGNQIHGDGGYTGNAGVNTNYVVNGVTGREHPRTQVVDNAQADNLVANYNVTIAQNVTSTEANEQLTKVPNYNANKEIAYANAQRLTPFYNAHFVVEQGNLLTGPLATKRIQKIVPMVDTKFVPNIVNEWTNVNKLWIVFADGTTEMVGITHHSTLSNTNIVEYTLNGTTVVYTPEQFKVDMASALAPLENTFQQFDYLGSEMYEKFNMNAYDGTDTWDNHRLLANFEASDTEEVKLAKKRRYLIEAMGLKESFNKVKAAIVEELSRAIGSHQVANWDKTQVSQWLRANVTPKAFEVLFGLAYMDRWYNVNFDDSNIRDLMKYAPDLTATQNTNTFDVLASISNEFRGNLTQRTDLVYANRLSSVTGKSNIVEFLSYFNAQLGSKSNAEWLKDSSKAIIREYHSKETINGDASTFRLMSANDVQRMLLPILTLSDNSIYIVTSMTNMTIGLVEAYVNLNWKETKPTVYQEQMNAMIARLEKYGALQRDHFDTWYRIANADVKERLVKTRPMITWSNMQVGVFSDTTNQRTSVYWAPAAGEKAPLGMREFLTVVGQWTRNNGAGAFANGTDTYFVGYEPWSDFGNSVFSHEAVHNIDNSVILGGFGRRDGMGAEAFATGMFQSVERPDYEAYGVNLVNDYSSASTRYHNGTMAQFQTVADIDNYFKHQFEVLHTLTAVEMDAITRLNATQQRALLGKIAPDNAIVTTEVYRRFTDDEWATLRQGKVDTQTTFETLSDLVNAQALYFYGNRSDIRNGYSTVDLFQGVYGVPEYTQTNGAGIFTFKKMAFELWAAYGYQNGFMGYASNQLKATATQQGQTFNDNFIMQKVSNNTYATVNAFKLATYEKALQDADNMQAFSFVWKGKTYQINSKADLQNVMTLAINQDVAAGSPRNENLKALKRAIYTSLFKQTNEFRTSIYR